MHHHPAPLQCKHGAQLLRMRRTDPFSKLFQVYKQHALSQVGGGQAFAELIASRRGGRVKTAWQHAGVLS